MKKLYYLVTLLLVFTPVFCSASEPLTVELLKTYMASKSHAAMDIRFSNTSTNDLNHWSVDIEVYDAAGKYLAKGVGMASYLKSGQSKIVSVTILDTQADDIKSWKATLTGVVGTSGQREDFKYNLEIR